MIVKVETELGGDRDSDEWLCQRMKGLRQQERSRAAEFSGDEASCELQEVGRGKLIHLSGKVWD